jgi:hypothetical protein
MFDIPEYRIAYRMPSGMKIGQRQIGGKWTVVSVGPTWTGR